VTVGLWTPSISASRSHKLDQIPHRDTFAKHNLLTRGQEVMVEVVHSQRRIITLRPGEMSLHHVRLVHGSPPNPSNDRRIGFAIRYLDDGGAARRRGQRDRSCAVRIATTISCQSRAHSVPRSGPAAPGAGPCQDIAWPYRGRLKARSGR